MFAKWLEEYRKILIESQFLSKLSAFLVAIYSLLSLYQLCRALYFSSHYLNSTLDERYTLIYSIIFQISIALIFASRFILHFFKSTKIFRLNQTLWLVGLIVLSSYWLVSRPPDGYYNFFPDEWIIFSHASDSLEFFGIWYLLLSPIRHLITFIHALIRVRKHKI